MTVTLSVFYIEHLTSRMAWEQVMGRERGRGSNLKRPFVLRGEPRCFCRAGHGPQGIVRFLWVTEETFSTQWAIRFQASSLKEQLLMLLVCQGSHDIHSSCHLIWFFLHLESTSCSVCSATVWSVLFVLLGCVYTNTGSSLHISVCSLSEINQLQIIRTWIQ